jgi:hypothetical protein
LLLPFLCAALLAFLLASVAFEITHGSHISFGAATNGSGSGAAAGRRGGGSQQQQQQQQGHGGADVSVVQRTMQTRVCGSPAVDGYAHVKPECLEASPTNKWWQVGAEAAFVSTMHLQYHAWCCALAARTQQCASG